MFQFTRKEAAAILGFKTVEGVRNLGHHGRLQHSKDENGHAVYFSEDIEELRAARELEGEPVMTPEEVVDLVMARPDPPVHHSAEPSLAHGMEVSRAQRRRRDELTSFVERHNQRAKARFVAEHLDEYAVGLALDLGLPLQCRARVLELVRAGLLRKVASPAELDVVGGYGDAPLKVQEGSPLVMGGPFYCREDVLRLRAEKVLRELCAARPQAEEKTLPAPPRDIPAAVEAIIRRLFGAAGAAPSPTEQGDAAAPRGGATP